MSDVTYIVVAGDWLAKIASDHGTTVGAIWNHPGNAEHRAKRGSPDVLYPGDVLVIQTAAAPPAPPEPPAPPAPPPPPVVDNTWPYPPPGPALTTPAPSWECPEGLCVCHPPTIEPEAVVHTLRFFDERAVVMPGAKFVITANGKTLRGPESADAQGDVELELPPRIRSLLVQWAPAGTPIGPFFPFARRYHVDIGDSGVEATTRRLAHLGYDRVGTLEDNIKVFQRDYHLLDPLTGEPSGRVVDVEAMLMAFHDQGLLRPRPSLNVRDDAAPSAVPSPIGATPGGSVSGSTGQLTVRFIDGVGLQPIAASSQALQVSNFITTKDLSAALSFDATSADPKVFRAEVLVPSGAVPKSCTIKVIRGGVVQFPFPDPIPFDLVAGSGGARNVGRTRLLRLVAHADENLASEAGVRSDPHHQTLLVQLGDEVTVECSDGQNTSTATQTVARPRRRGATVKGKPLQHDIIEFPLRFVTFRRRNTATPEPLLSKDVLLTMVEEANRRLAQCALRIVPVIATVDQALAWPGPGDTAALATLDGPITDIRLTAQERVLATLHTDPTRCSVFIVETVQQADAGNIHFPPGMAYPALRNQTSNRAIENFVALSLRAQQFGHTLAHELMHVLLNRNHRTGEPTTSLFEPNATAAGPDVDARRIGPNSEIATDDTHKMRQSAAKLPRS